MQERAEPMSEKSLPPKIICHPSIADELRKLYPNVTVETDSTMRPRHVYYMGGMSAEMLTKIKITR